MSEQALFELADLRPILPHREPFLFVDRVLKLDPNKSIVAERTLRPEEPHFAGHFPGRPIMPGVLITEALAQTSGLLIGLSEKLSSAAPPEKPKAYFLALANMKFTHPAVPGDVLVLRAKDPQLLQSKATRDFARSKSIPEFTGELENYYSQPVIDETGATNRYDKNMELVPARWVNGRTTDLDANNKFLASFGLELAPARRPQEWLLMD